MDNIMEMLYVEDYDRVREKVKEELADDPDNAALWYGLFLAENDNYFVSDDEFNNELAYTKALELGTFMQQCTFQAEYTLFKTFPDIPLLSSIIRSIQIHNYGRAVQYLKGIDEVHFEDVPVKERFMQVFDYLLQTEDSKKEILFYLAVLELYDLKMPRKIFRDLIIGLRRHAVNMGMDLTDFLACHDEATLMQFAKTILDREEDDGAIFTLEQLLRLLSKISSSTGKRAVKQIVQNVNMFYRDILEEYIHGEYDPNLLARYYYKRYIAYKTPAYLTNVYRFVMEAVTKKPDSDIYFFAGKCYDAGIGVTQDIGKAIYYYEKSAEAGNAPAINNLAVFYMKGAGEYIHKDYSTAFRLFQKSAGCGNDTAKYNVALCTYNGTGTEANFRKGLELMEELGKTKNILAVNFLCKAYDSMPNGSTKSCYWYGIKHAIEKEEKEFELKD